MELRHTLLLGEAEIRQAGDGSRRLRGRFPYRKRATMRARGAAGRPVKEEFAPRAFGFAVEDPEREVHLLVGHSFDKPLASRRNGSLMLADGDDALTFEAEISDAIQRASYWVDFWAGFTSGLVVGLSPGFRVPPADVVPDAEETVEEDPEEGDALIRVINQAVLFELSLVTRPAYEETEVEARALAQVPPVSLDLRRWLL